MSQENGTHLPSPTPLDLQTPHHTLFKTAFTSLTLNTLNPFDSSLKILDINTKTGIYLHDLHTKLSHPQTSDLVGTDSVLLPVTQRPFPIPKNMRFITKDKTEEWPKDLRGYFDLVHQCNDIHDKNFGEDFDGAVNEMAKILPLVKPGGAVLLIDWCFEEGSGRMEDVNGKSETTTSKLFKMLGHSGNGGMLGGELPAILDVAASKAGIQLGDVGLKKSLSRVGVGAPEGMEEVGIAWLEEMRMGVDGGMGELVEKVMEEAKTMGFDLTWYAAWARRAGGEDVVELPA